MKIARTESGFAVSQSGRDWVALNDLALHASTTAEVIENWDVITRRLTSTGSTLTDSAMRCPIVKPSKVLAIGLNYMDHIRETGSPVPERPVLFAKFPNALNDPYGEIVMDPELTEQGDYEVELAVVIGRRTRGVSEQEALDHVFGYTVANDVSARDWQFRDPQFSRSKSFDSFCPMGPWITTADEIADPQDLTIRSFVNGEARQNGSTKEMVFSTARLIAFLSRGMTLEPGDVILTGTPHGVGFAMDPPQYLVPGDTVRCEIEKLGNIENAVVGP